MVAYTVLMICISLYENNIFVLNSYLLSYIKYNF